MFNTPNSIDKIQVLLLTSLEQSVMMDLLYASSVYVDHVEEQARKDAKSVASNNTLSDEEKSLQLEFLGDDVHYAKEAQGIAEELAIIGLYKTIEIRIKKAAEVSKLFSKTKIKELYKIDKFIEHFEAIGVDVSNAQNFKEFEELKLLNNCLKHSGEVDSRLAATNPVQWTSGESITNCSTHFYRLLEPSVFFLKNLGSSLRDKM